MNQDDFEKRAEAEMKLNDAKMMELAMIRKLDSATIEERILFALKKSGNDATAALDYLNDHNMIHQKETVSLADVEKFLKKN